MKKFCLIRSVSFALIAFSGLTASGALAQETPAPVIPDARCKEFAASIFKPCICSQEVPEEIKYRPKVTECGGRAGAVLFGEFADSFSVVLRDKQNRDRWPARGYHHCTKRESDVLGLNKCSAFKCQKVLRVMSSSVGEGAQQICCFGEAGSSAILRGATRLTIKVADIPSSTNDPLLRVCLNKFSAKVPLN